MKITSTKAQLLNEIFNDLKRKKIESKKSLNDLSNAMGDITIYITLGALSLQAIDILLNYLSYRQDQKKNYIHFKYNNGTEIKFTSLSKNEQEEKLKELRATFKNLKYIDIS